MQNPNQQNPQLNICTCQVTALGHPSGFGLSAGSCRRSQAGEQPRALPCTGLRLAQTPRHLHPDMLWVPPDTTKAWQGIRPQGTPTLALESCRFSTGAPRSTCFLPS